MKISSAIISCAMLTAALSLPVLAQEQQNQQYDANMRVEQQACEGDVYALCGEAIPDQGRIAKCLRKKWSKVSHDCRKVMASYGKRHNGDND
jgi:hypothetical protein